MRVGVIDDLRKTFRVEDANMALLDLDDTVIHKFGKSPAHGFKLQAQIAADFFTGHP